MSQWGFYFNQNRCLGCKTCVLACKNWNENKRGDTAANIRPEPSSYEVAQGAAEPGAYFIDKESGSSNYKLYRQYNMKENWRRVENYAEGTSTVDSRGVFNCSSIDRRYISTGCNHCADPACIKVCPMGCISKDGTFGAVLVNNTGCISCGRCQDACPWNAPQFSNPDFRAYAISDRDRPKMTKCTLCLDRIREGLRPACVAACWNRALDAGPMNELKQKYPDETLADFNSDYVDVLGINTKPNIIAQGKKSYGR